MRSVCFGAGSRESFLFYSATVVRVGVYVQWPLVVRSVLRVRKGQSARWVQLTAA